MKELNFKVSVEETNLILEGLGNLPFARVYALVEKIQRQASEQLRGPDQAAMAPEVSAAGKVVAGNGASNGQ